MKNNNFPSSGFSRVIDEIIKERRQNQDRKLVVTVNGETIPFARWFRQWVKEAIDRHGIPVNRVKG